MMPPANTTESTPDRSISLSAREDYTNRLAYCEKVLEALQAKHRTMAWIRTVLFTVAAPCLFFGYLGDAYNTVLLTIGWIFAIGFLIAIVRHEHLRLQRLQQESDKQLFEHLLARLARDWKNVPGQQLLSEYTDLAYADDLDIAGEASLLSVLSIANTFPGRRVLQSWVAQPPSEKEFKARQKATRQLTEYRDFRLRILKTVRSTDVNASEEYGLPKWATSPNWLKQHPFAVLLSYLGPAIVIGGMLLAGAFMLAGNREYAGWAAASVGIGFLVNIAVTVFWGSWIHEIFHHVTGEHRASHQFASVFSAMRDLPDTSNSDSTVPADDDILANIKHQSVEATHCAETGFAKLLTGVRLANLQGDVLLYFAVYLPLQLLILYDFRVLKLLEKWKAQFGEHVEGWFHALGNAEAVISCATIADEYPDWCYPSMERTTKNHLVIKEMGHPLLKDDDRVCNDLTLTSDAPLLLVTGSNMAGKSTFLRSFGLNVLLARTGAPVCAKEFNAPLCELATSIRIRDSLSDGVSFFMAELKRLKEVVDLAKTHDQNAELPQIFFLLDEILQGTNSQERQIAVASVLQQLLESNAIGMISTHDLDLADAEEVSNISQVVHFREYFEQSDGAEVMRFDYKMRPGATPTTNALKLLKLVGLHR